MTSATSAEVQRVSQGMWAGISEPDSGQDVQENHRTVQAGKDLRAHRVQPARREQREGWDEGGQVERRKEGPSLIPT